MQATGYPSAPDPPGSPERPGLPQRIGRWGDRILLRSVPEYHLFDSETQRIRAIKELDGDLENSRGFWRAMLAIWIALVVLANLSTCLIPMFLPRSFPGRVPLAIGLQVLLAVGLTLVIWRHGIKKRLREKLIAEGVPVCRRCGYCLRGLPAASDACPECGDAPAADVRRLIGSRDGLRCVRVTPVLIHLVCLLFLQPSPATTRGSAIPFIDLAGEAHRQVVVDREAGQYLGHPTTVLLEDGKTILCVYPRGHGAGGIILKRSDDGGLTWSERLSTPQSWETSRETPTIHRVVDAGGTKRLILWSGLYPARLSVSEDDGETWSELAPVGEWGGIVVMSSVVKLKEPGHYLALFHDDGRFIGGENQQKDPPVFTLYQTKSVDGGLTWSEPEAIFASSEIHLCEPGAVRSPDGKRIAVLLRENARRKNAHIIFSDDEGKTWSAPRELPAALTGDRHIAAYAPDGRLFVTFRDMAEASPTRGDWVAWIGTWEDLETGAAGQYRVRLMDNRNPWDAAYPGLEVLPDGTIVTTTYGHWAEGEEPYIVSVRLKLEELDEWKPQ